MGTGLANQVPYYDFALDLITDIDNDEDFSDEQQEMIEHDAEVLYGLIHARYILTNRGLHAMLPVGRTDQKSKESVKLYCPKCGEMYKPKSSRHENVDGAYFGTSFPHLFFLVFPELNPEPNKETYVPKVFGFRLHQSSHQRSIEAAREAANARRKK